MTYTEMTNILLPIFTRVIFVPFIVTLIFYKYFRKFLWGVPAISFVAMCGMFLRDVALSNETTFNNKLLYYFHNDSCLSFYLLYIPTIISSIIFSLIFYLIIFIKKKNMGV